MYKNDTPKHEETNIIKRLICGEVQEPVHFTTLVPGNIKNANFYSISVNDGNFFRH
jgi:hypothetical protein